MATSVHFYPDWQYKINGQVKAYMEALAKRIERDAKTLCPTDSGRLKRSIDHELDGHSVSTYVARIGTNVRYAIFVEFGTGPHVIRAKNGKMLRWEAGGEVHFARGVLHPGTQAQPFLRPALLKERR